MSALGDPALGSSTSNYRHSFFGGPVSTRLACRSSVGVIVPTETSPGSGHGKAVVSGSDERIVSKRPRSNGEDAPDPKVLAARRKAVLARMQTSFLTEGTSTDRISNSSLKPPTSPATVRSPRPAIGPHTASSAAKVVASPSRRAYVNPNKSIAYSSTGQKVVTLTPAPAQARSLKRPGRQAALSSSRGAVKVRRFAVNDTAPPPPKDPNSKQCRNCGKTKHYTDYFVDKRLGDGMMHICATCAELKGLSGKRAIAPPARRDTGRSEQAARSDDPSAGVFRHVRAQGRAASQQKISPPRVSPTRGGFFAGSGTRAAAPAVEAIRRGAIGERLRERDDYEPDFVDEGGSDEDDWRAELDAVTRGLYREMREDRSGTGRGMEATLEEMRREEARSRRLGRREDAEAEAEEERARRAKAAAGAARRRAGGKGTGTGASGQS